MTKIIFADLTHTGTVIDANNFPLAIGYLAAATKARLGDSVELALFKYPEKLSQHLVDQTPAIACFSNYMWNERLQLTYARAIKAHHPGVVTIFGGPNYPIDPEEQHEWLQQHPEVDFYVDGEGEVALVDLVESLQAARFEVTRIKHDRMRLPNVHYVADGEFVCGELLPRLVDLDSAVPSPYLTGLMDQFFDGKLTPMIQTARGCPYSCTFCHDGIAYMSKTRRFTQTRIEAELEYVRHRVTVPALTLADLNWGMFPEDIDTARSLARMKERQQWPALIQTATAKNQKERVIEMARILGDSMHVGASIQSTAPDVLKNIKRSNIGFDAIVTMAKESRKSNTSTFTEIILSLPGDTREKHFKSVFDMLDAGIQDMRTFQFILLPGTEGSDAATRTQHKYITRFRVLPRCFGRYTIYQETFPVAEIHEVCVGNETMPFEDYTECRRFNLTLAMFNNGNLVEEILQITAALGVQRSSVLARIHALATAPESPLRPIYDEFRRDEEKNFWADKQSLLDFLAEDGNFAAYLSGEFGSNQIYRYRALAVFTMLKHVVAIVVQALRDQLVESGKSDPWVDLFIEELAGVILASKSDVTHVEKQIALDVHFDFEALSRLAYADHPLKYRLPTARKLILGHTAEKRTILKQYFNQYGTSIDGLMYFIHRNPARALYREITTDVDALSMHQAAS